MNAKHFYSLLGIFFLASDVNANVFTCDIVLSYENATEREFHAATNGTDSFLLDKHFRDCYRTAHNIKRKYNADSVKEVVVRFHP